MHQPVCVCEQPLCTGEGGGYYATAVYSGRAVYLLGPFDTHEEALAEQPRSEAIVRKEYAHDPHLPWFGYGTARVKWGPLPAAKFGR